MSPEPPDYTQLCEENLSNFWIYIFLVEFYTSKRALYIFHSDKNFGNMKMNIFLKPRITKKEEEFLIRFPPVIYLLEI